MLATEGIMDMRGRLGGLRILALAALVAGVPSVAFAQDPPPLPSDAFFRQDVIQRVDLQIHSLDWEKLKANFQENTFYTVAFGLNGEFITNAGVRSRGFGSRSSTKPGLRIDFNRYVTSQTFKGVSAIILDNLTQDPSAIHETVTMKLFARFGIPAPREAHVRLYVNDRYVGLYTLVEEVNKQLLARVFGSIGDDVQNDGYLYEYNYILGQPWRFNYLGSDFAPYKERFDPKTHESKSDAELYGPIENLVRLVNTLRPDELMSGLGEYLDLTAFMRYIAAQNFVAQNDGFLGYDGMNNFYLYRLENSQRHVLIAWDEDNAFFGPDFPIDLRHEDNVLMQKAMQVRELHDEYYRALGEIARLAEEPTGPDGASWLEHETRRQLDLLYDALREDSAKPYSMDEHENARVAVLIFSRDRPRSVHTQSSQISQRAAQRRPE
jgi:spore coat protein CotH